MTRDEMSQVMDRVFEECRALREAGQKEYAGGEDAFGNFNRLAARLGIDRKQVLLVYLAKHQDGVDSFIRGHRSQREDVRGRINDQIVYLCLLRGMIEEEGQSQMGPQPIQRAGRLCCNTFDGMPHADYCLNSKVPK